MKKLLPLSLLTLIVAMASVSANACPAGQHPYGGTGPHHDGGYCA